MVPGNNVFGQSQERLTIVDGPGEGHLRLDVEGGFWMKVADAQGVFCIQMSLMQVSHFSCMPPFGTVYELWGWVQRGEGKVTRLEDWIPREMYYAIYDPRGTAEPGGRHVCGYIYPFHTWLARASIHACPDLGQLPNQSQITWLEKEEYSSVVEGMTELGMCKRQSPSVAEDIVGRTVTYNYYRLYVARDGRLFAVYWNGPRTYRVRGAYTLLGNSPVIGDLLPEGGQAGMS